VDLYADLTVEYVAGADPRLHVGQVAHDLTKFDSLAELHDFVQTLGFERKKGEL